jgi:hypothetical protein
MRPKFDPNDPRVNPTLARNYPGSPFESLAGGEEMAIPGMGIPRSEYGVDVSPVGSPTGALPLGGGGSPGQGLPPGVTAADAPANAGLPRRADDYMTDPNRTATGGLPAVQAAAASPAPLGGGGTSVADQFAVFAGGPGGRGGSVAGGLPSISGSGSGGIADSAEDAMMEKPNLALSALLRGQGINPDSNPFAQDAINRLGPSANVLAAIQEAMGGGADMDTNAFMGNLMGGQINGADLIRQGLERASTDPLLRATLGEKINPQEMIRAMQATDRRAPLLREGATLMRQRALQQQQERALMNPTGPDADAAAWLELMRR